MSDEHTLSIANAFDAAWLSKRLMDYLPLGEGTWRVWWHPIDPHAPTLFIFDRAEDLVLARVLRVERTLS